MKILNRSAITVSAKQPFVDWANALTPELLMEVDILGESHTYLTNPDFDNAEAHLKKYFKQVFEEELESVLTNQEDWPQKRDIKTFYEWFDIEVSDWVQDLSKKSLFNLL
ncbi:hypothetical protein [Flavobacterium oreochromis]|uniref:hypothetical protein n=1 Tax=Flavobacterium oreochromis TaxID=2906078 RepID=UPI00385A8103